MRTPIPLDSEEFITQTGVCFRVRPWRSEDRQPAAELIAQVLAEFGLGWEPETADRDVLAVESCYLAEGGEFWVVEHQGEPVGTAAYRPTQRSPGAVEIRKMYLLPPVRGMGLGSHLLNRLEAQIAGADFSTIWIETASVMQAAIQLYESRGYTAATGVETQRCDRIYVKHLN